MNMKVFYLKLTKLGETSKVYILNQYFWSKFRELVVTPTQFTLNFTFI